MTDEEVEQLIGSLLRTGVLLAAALVFLGGIIYLARHGTAQPDYRVFRGVPAPLRHPSGIMHQSVTWHGRGLIQLGLLVLVATPVARVALSLYAFARQGDRTYVVVSLIVLAVLAYSLAGGHL